MHNIQVHSSYVAQEYMLNDLMAHEVEKIVKL